MNYIEEATQAYCKLMVNSRMGYNNPRENQIEIIADIINAFENGYDNVILCGSTGTGKSVIGGAISQFYETAHILTPLKTLQDQYIKDFPQFFALKGRSGYVCHLHEYINELKKLAPRTFEGINGVDCSLKTCKKKFLSPEMTKCINERKCNFGMALIAAQGNTHVIHNFASFLSMASKFFPKPRDLLLIDECHNLSQSVASHYGNRISKRMLAKRDIMTNINPSFLKLDHPNEEFIDWIEWLMTEHNTIYDQVKDDDNPNIAYYERNMKKYGTIYQKIKNDPDNWIIQVPSAKNGKPIPDTIDISPIDVKDLVDNFLLKYGNKRLFMSATVDQECFANSIGLTGDNSTYFVESPSNFPKNRRPFVYMPSGSLTYSNYESNIDNVVSSIDHILEHHHDEKGIIHTQSFKICQRIIKNIGFKYQNRLIDHMDGDREGALNRHLNSTEPTVLISPSMSEGVSLDNDLARFQVITKTPFPYLKDKRTKIIKERNKKWYPWTTILTIVQQYGRGMRSKDDWCITYFLDSAFDNFRTWNGDMFPKYLSEAIIDIEQFDGIDID